MAFFNRDECATHRSEITTRFGSKEKTNDLSTALPKANLQLHANTDLCYLLYCSEIELFLYNIPYTLLLTIKSDTKTYQNS